MSDYTRPPTWEDVKRTVTLLRDAGVEFALVGAYALAAHGFIRFTEDLDLLVNPSRENTRKWIHALAALPDGATRELQGKEDLFETDGPYACRINDEFTLDMLPAACGHPWAKLAPYVEQVQVDDVLVPVLSLEGLLLTKAGLRPKDQADRLLLERVLAERRTP